MPELAQPAVYTWYHTNWAVRSGDRTFIGWHEADGIYVGGYDEATQTWTSFRLMACEPDDHNVASIGVRGDGRLIVAYCVHDDEFMRVRISTNPLDASAWGTEQRLVTGTAVTYPNLIYLSGEDRWYLFHRDRGPSLDIGTVQYVSSDDDGVTWSPPTVVVTPPGTDRPYAKYGTNGVDRIDIAYTDGHPREFVGNSVYHIFYDGAWKTSAGVSVGTLPIAPADGTQVYDGTTVESWTWDCATDGSNPVILFATFPDADPALDHRYQHARWDGAAWGVNEITPGGGKIVEASDDEDWYSGGLNFDHADPSTVYLSRETSTGVWEIERWTTADLGVNWSSTAITSAGTKSLRPFVVRGDTRVIWFAGRYDTFRDFACNLKADPVLFVSEAPSDPAPAAILRTLTGSHTPVFEARIVTGHPVGDDPEGTEITVVGGDVTYDGTAQIRASMNLETLGIDETNGLSVFPRFPANLLTPIRGAEVFIRYGIDLGTSIAWTPLGYFRLDEDDQPTAPYGPIVLTGRDRMVGLADAELLAPRTYEADVTRGDVVEDLVRDIYPGAVIIWDDDSNIEPLGRVLLVEESRVEALREIATTSGKIVYFDDTGQLRFEAALDETVPLWTVNAGHDGVLVHASRRLTRVGAFNAVIATGQGADDQPSVRAVAIDNNPASPTYFFGEFGQVPRRFESPLITSQNQAVAAAVEQLRRTLGAQYQVEFTSVTNPTLRPYFPVRIVYRDGNREIHVLQRVRIPLGRQPMTGTTRTSTLATIRTGGLL